VSFIETALFFFSESAGVNYDLGKLQAATRGLALAAAHARDLTCRCGMPGFRMGVGSRRFLARYPSEREVFELGDDNLG